MEQAFAEFLKTLTPQKIAELMAAQNAAQVADAPDAPGSINPQIPSTSAQEPEPVRSESPANTETEDSRAASMVSDVKKEGDDCQVIKEVITEEGLKSLQRDLEEQEHIFKYKKLKNQLVTVKLDSQRMDRSTAEMNREIEQGEGRQRSQEHLSPKPPVMDRMPSPSEPGPAPPSRIYMGRTTDPRPSRRPSRRSQVDQVPAPPVQQPRHEEYKSYRNTSDLQRAREEGRRDEDPAQEQPAEEEPEPEVANRMFPEMEVIFEPLRYEEKPDLDEYEDFEEEYAYNLPYFNEGEHPQQVEMFLAMHDDIERAQFVQRTEQQLNADPRLREMFDAEERRNRHQETSPEQELEFDTEVAMEDAVPEPEVEEPQDVPTEDVVREPETEAAEPQEIPDGRGRRRLRRRAKKSTPYVFGESDDEDLHGRKHPRQDE